VLNGSNPATGTLHVSAPDLSNTGAASAGAPGPLVFGAAAMAAAQNQLAASDPDLLQQLHLSGG
jgi:hypothetical protein